MRIVSPEAFNGANATARQQIIVCLEKRGAAGQHKVLSEAQTPARDASDTENKSVHEHMQLRSLSVEGMHAETLPNVCPSSSEES